MVAFSQSGSHNATCVTPDEREAATASVADSETSQKMAGREVTTNHHVQPGSSERAPSSNGGVVNVWKRGSEGGGGKRRDDKEGGKTNGQGPEASTQVYHQVR